MQKSPDHLDPEIWTQVNRQHIRKCLAELSHERILQPQWVADCGEAKRYRLTSDLPSVEYEFEAVLLPLDHWVVNTETINKKVDGENAPLDALAFIIEFANTLGMSQAQLPIYLEEISATLNSAAFKIKKPYLTAGQLINADFQAVETGMNEGHPSFIANNGRIGFDAEDFARYAPEAAMPFRILWLAAHHAKAEFSSSTITDYESLVRQELDCTTRERFERLLLGQQVNPADYILIPVHPWQWRNKLAHAYSTDLALKNLVFLGEGDDYYQPQQSIRTMFNVTQPQKYYVKTALSILNMGFVRGLSAAYMSVTPAINDWVFSVVDNDDILKEYGFKVLRELAAVGYRNDHYCHESVKDNPYKKMLAALWRESPVNFIEPGQQLMTMASLLHVDPQGGAVLPELIKASRLSPTQWIARYLQAYLTPLLHCLCQHKMVFMPHGENIIMVMENHVPVSVFMKDIGEEVCLLNREIVLPEKVQRIAVNVPEDHEVLSIFTDVFDCFFRYVTGILYEHLQLDPKEFWRCVAMTIWEYQEQHPEFAEAYQRYNLFADEFLLSCLNRLQLANNQQMIDLTDPSKLLQFAGNLKNPIAAFSETPVMA
ncbi:IucA/IucC family siderophore biosynthesis protein [Marinibactrum halimedae]|nr:IucA/IucC family siderophore biosynthesis protein [Marinibactrum halimedae]